MAKTKTPNQNPKTLDFELKLKFKLKMNESESESEYVEATINDVNDSFTYSRSKDSVWFQLEQQRVKRQEEAARLKALEDLNILSDIDDESESESESDSEDLNGTRQRNRV